MSIILKSSPYSFNRTLSDKLITQAIEGALREESTHIGIWAKIKDWFCGTNSAEALKKIYDLTHDNEAHHSDNKTKTESVLKKAAIFYQLKHMASPVYQDRFQASVVKLDSGCHVFSFSIEGAMDEQKLAYGNTQEEILAVDNQRLTNDSKLLDEKNINQKGLNGTLETVKYIPATDCFEGVSTENQRRINSDLLKTKTKKQFAEDPTLAKGWIIVQLKCFDYYSGLRTSLDSVESLDITQAPGTDDEWVYDFAMSLNEIKVETMRAIAQSINISCSEIADSFAYEHSV